ncbi:MAG: serine hydrolase, partial [Chloroflexota bacterium]
MHTKKEYPAQGYYRSLLVLMGVILVLSVLVGCGPSAEELEAVDYTPPPNDEWDVSTPEEQGLDPKLVAELYLNASELETVYSVLVFKNGYLVAEDYFNGGSAEQNVNIHSATKSITSGLVAIALEEGCLSSLDQKMMEFFPEFADRITDPRKNQITIREMLQMRAGYPWEESGP